MITKNKDAIYLLKRNDVLAIESLLTGLRVALNAIIAARTIDPSGPIIRPKEVNNFDQLVDEIFDYRDKDLRNVPDLF